MTDLESMVKVLKLACIQRILTTGHRQNWKTVSEYFLRRCGGLELLLTAVITMSSLLKTYPTSTRTFYPFSVNLKHSTTATPYVTQF